MLSGKSGQTSQISEAKHRAMIQRALVEALRDAHEMALERNETVMKEGCIVFYKRGEAFTLALGECPYGMRQGVLQHIRRLNRTMNPDVIVHRFIAPLRHGDDEHGAGEALPMQALVIHLESKDGGVLQMFRPVVLDGRAYRMIHDWQSNEEPPERLVSPLGGQLMVPCDAGPGPYLN